MRRSIRGTLASLAVVAGLLAGPMVAVSAAGDEYPPGAQNCLVEVIATLDDGRVVVQVLCRLDGKLQLVRVFIESTPVHLGTFTTDANGALDVTVTLPEGVKPGSHHINVFKAADSPAVAPAQPKPQVLAGQPVVGPPLGSVPVTVRGDGKDKTLLLGNTSDSAEAAAGGASSSAPLAAAAVGLVGIGAGGLIISRRRRRSPQTAAPE